MDKQECLRQSLEQAFQAKIKSFNVVKLQGDASDRSYSRLTWHDKQKARSCILMDLAVDSAARFSEEKVSEASSPIQELPFLNIQKHLFACKIPVPEIFFYDKTQGWLFLEDLGDMTFAEKLGPNPNDYPSLLDDYKKAIDILISMQLDATPVLNHQTIAHTRHFDQALFAWEFDHFIEYGIEKRNGTPLPSSKKTALQDYFSEISSRLAALPQVFTHRDYHSRNLMLQSDSGGTKIHVIDFQDALMGPAQYDLASLLRDSYIDLPEAILAELLSYYIKQWEARSGKVIDQDLFRESFDLISIQRNLKAAGRFVYIDQIKKKPHLLPYVTPTLLKVRETLRKYGELKPLYNLLAEDVPELK